MAKKCKQRGCYCKGNCADGRCHQHTYATKDLREYSARSYPRTGEPHLGIEIECIARNYNSYRAMLAQRITPSSDGSLPEYGAEFKLCQPHDKIIPIVERLADRLIDIGCRVNGSCGLHVHLDMRGAHRWCYPGEMAHWFQPQESAWFRLIPPSRRDSHFCATIDPSLARGGMSHYTWINFSPYRTLEVRLHPGTLNRYKIAGWLYAMRDLMMIVRSPDPLPVLTDENGVIDSAKWIAMFSPPAREYLQARLNCGGTLNGFDGAENQ